MNRKSCINMSFMSILILLPLTTLSQSQNRLPTCKVGTVKVKVLSNWCYNFKKGINVNCKKAYKNFNTNYKPNQFKAKYEYYIRKNHQIVGEKTQVIPNNQVTTICLEQFQTKKPYAIIITNYNGGFTYTTISTVPKNIKLVIQPILDVNHKGSNVIFCKQSFTPGSRSEICK